MSLKSLIEKLDQLNESVVNEISDADMDATSLAKHRSRLQREKTRMGLTMPKPEGGPRKADVPAAARRARGETPLSLDDLKEQGGKEIDYSTLEIDGIDYRDAPEFSDAYFSYGEYTDGTPLPDEVLEKLTDDGDLRYQYLEKVLYEGKKSKDKKVKDKKSKSDDSKPSGDWDESEDDEYDGHADEEKYQQWRIKRGLGREMFEGSSVRGSRVHRGSYGSEYQGDEDDDDDDKPAKKPAPAVKRGRGRPKKAADSTGQVKNYDTQTLSNWIIGNLPKKLPKGVSSTKHKLKDWMEHVESTMLAESIIAEGGVKEIGELIDQVKSGKLDVYDIISGKYAPTSKVEEVFADALQRKYDEIAEKYQGDGGADFEKILDVLVDEIDTVLSEQDQVSVEPAKSTSHVIKQGTQVIGQVDNPQLANTIKQAIGQGQMKLAGSDLNEEEQIDEMIPALAALAGSSLAGAAGAGTMGRIAGAAIGNKIGSAIEDNMDEAVDPDAVTDQSMKTILKMLDEYVRDGGRERVEPILSKDASMRTSGTRSDGSDRYEPRYTGPKAKASSLSPETGSLRSDRHSTRYMEEENDSGEHSPITGDEKTTTPKPMKPMYPTGKENKMKTYDVVDDTMSDKMMYESKKSKKQHYDKDMYDSDDASKKDGMGSIVKRRKAAVAEESTTKRDDRAERAGRRVAKDIEYDERKKDDIHGKRRDAEDAKAERAGKRVAKDIEYDEKVDEGRVGNFVKKSAQKILKPLLDKDKEVSTQKTQAERDRVLKGLRKTSQTRGKVDEVKAKPDYLDLDGDDNRKESMKKAAADKKRSEKVDEDWDTDYETPESEKGKYKGKTVAELKKMKAALMKKEKRTKAEQGKVAELNFAIRAKQADGGKWGKIKETDAQMESWEKSLSGMLIESVTVNTTTGTDPDTNSVNISATGEDAAQLMALLQNAGLHAGATTDGYQQVQYQQDQVNEETTDAEFTIPEGAAMPMPKGMGVSQNVDECGEVAVIEPTTQDAVIGQLGTESDDDGNNLLDFIKKIMSHGAEQYGDSAPPEQDYADERVNEEDMEEGNEFSGALAKAKVAGEKEFEVDGKRYPVKEEEHYWAEEEDTNEGYEDANWAAMRSDDKIQDADAVAYHAGADTTNRDPNLNVTEEPEHGRKGDGDIADPTYAGKNRQGKVSESETCNECGAMYEGEDHACSENLNEWANSPMGQSEDEDFETEMEFMTKAISGGLNNMKQDQTTLPSTRVRTGAESAPFGSEMSIGAELKRLAGIN